MLILFDIQSFHPPTKKQCRLHRQQACEIWYVEHENLFWLNNLIHVKLSLCQNHWVSKDSYNMVMVWILSPLLLSKNYKLSIVIPGQCVILLSLITCEYDELYSLPLQAYTSTDSVDTFLPLPPPYTPNADDPLPIIYQLAASQSTPDIHGNFSPGSVSPAIAGVHVGQLRNASDSDTRRSRSSNDQNQNGEGRRTRSRHRRRRPRGTNQNPASEDRSSLISAAQDTAVNSSLEDNSIVAEDNTQSNTNTQQCRNIPGGEAATDNTNVTSSVNNEDNSICDNTLTDNVIMDSSERGEFIELGDTLTIPSGVDPDRVTLRSETSGSFCSGADSASGCSTLDQTSVSSLHKGKTHRRSVSGVSCISKTPVEPSVSKVDEEPCECKCSCKCDCKPEVSSGEKCSECDKSTNKEDESFTENVSNNRKNCRTEDSHRITEQSSLDPQNSSRQNVTTNLTFEGNDTASFVWMCGLFKITEPECKKPVSCVLMVSQRTLWTKDKV